MLSFPLAQSHPAIVLLSHSVPQGCSGVDTDGDALPDTCDNCPYVFNPGQDKEMCAPLEGVCPAGVASNVLWSPTSAGSIDMKPCAPPLTGEPSAAVGSAVRSVLQYLMQWVW